MYGIGRHEGHVPLQAVECLATFIIEGSLKVAASMEGASSGNTSPTGVDHPIFPMSTSIAASRESWPWYRSRCEIGR